jgi:shikimate dehydrogenase
LAIGKKQVTCWQTAMKKYGLIGNPLTHSFSKKYFEEKFRREKISDCSYGLYPLQNIQQLVELIKTNTGLLGLNVTIPYKEQVIPFLTELDNEAKDIGAVNCIKIQGNKWKGYNTDAYGFEASLKKFIANPNGLNAFVLGSGGSAKSVIYILEKLHIPFVKVSRSAKAGCIGYAEIKNHFGPQNLFINTTPLGMYPEISTAPEIPYAHLKAGDYLFDLIYNPEETEFLKNGRAAGAKTRNGLEMLQLQAEKSWEIWNSPGL